MEGENPTRRYKWFRPRQAMEGALAPQATATNFATVSLYNDSRVSHYLVVRSLGLQLNGNFPTKIMHQGTLGSHLGTEAPLIPAEARLPGLIYYGDQAAAEPGAQIYEFQSNSRDYTILPFAVIPPGWSWGFQTNTVAGTLAYFNLLWEAIFADELDFLDW